MPTYIIAKYHCEISGDPDGGVDYQVRYYTDSLLNFEAENRLRAEAPVEYLNPEGEPVRWLLDEIVAIEADPSLRDGQEFIGFITGEPKEIADTEQGNREVRETPAENLTE